MPHSHILLYIIFVGFGNNLKDACYQSHKNFSIVNCS